MERFTIRIEKKISQYVRLNRELNELKKPSSDNPEILRFFRYMKAAKIGQDGKDCNLVYSDCSSLQELDQPAMISTYNDINKLVQARALFGLK